MTREICLTKGYVTTVDDCDFEFLSRFRWCALSSGKRVYAVRWEKPNGKTLACFMHREILNAQQGKTVDHRDGNTLNNTRANLRECTQQQNVQARHHIAAKCGFKGVSRADSSILPWRARIRVDGKRINLGNFDTPEKAAAAYDHAATEHFGEFAVINDRWMGPLNLNCSVPL